MATVYRAKDHRLGGREVAVKLLHPHLSNRDDSLVRFKNEADAAAKLEHDAILKIFDAGIADQEDAFIVMEFVRGDTLAATLEKRPFLVPEIGALIAYEVTKALGAAHEMRILHRDVKPENVMIREDGAVKLMDFGIARALDNHRLTMTGALMGSPAHMAPEHIEGKSIDFRADVFSTGTLLYFVTTGELPFTGNSPHELLQRILKGEYSSARQINPKVSTSLSKIIDRALARRPEDRYPTIEAMGDALQNYLEGFSLEDSTAELRKWKEDPEEYECGLRDRIVETLLPRVKQEFRGFNKRNTFDDINLLMAISPENREVNELLESMKKVVVRGSRVRTSIILVATAGLTIGLLSLLTERAFEPEASTPLGAPPIAVSLQENEVFPQADPESEVRSTPEREESEEPSGAPIRPSAQTGVVTENPPKTENPPPPAQVAADSAQDEAPVRSPFTPEESEKTDAVEQEKSPAAQSVKGEKKDKTTPFSPKNNAEASITRREEIQPKSRALQSSTKPRKESAQSSRTSIEKREVKEAKAAQVFPVLVRTVPPAATLFLDGKAYPELQTGPRTLSLASGRHSYRVEFPGCPVCATSKGSFVIDPGMPIREKVFEIGVKPATLMVEASPKARIWVDNKPRGRTGKPIPLSIPYKDIKRGKAISVRLASTGYEEKKLNIRVKPGQVTHEIVLLAEEN